MYIHIDKQREEKRLRQLKEMEKDQPSTDTWADKFSVPRKPAAFPDQSEAPIEGHVGPGEITLDTGRVNSAPNHSVSVDDNQNQ